MKMELEIQQKILKREMEEMRENYKGCIQKTNFFQDAINESLEKDKKVLESLLEIKNSQQSASQILKLVRKVNRL